MKTAILKVLPVSVLKPAEYNPRKKLKPGDKEYEKIKNSIEEFGFADPLVVNADMTIIGGHQRLTVAMDLGYTEVPCAMVDVDKTREKALNIALNKITGAWDENLLADLLKDIQDSDFDLGKTGFEPPEIETLFNKVHDKAVKEDDFDVESELKQPAFSKKGDIWMLGRHKVLCGDSTLPESYQALLGDVKANMILSDLPYFVAYHGTAGTIQNDDLNDADAYDFTLKAIESLGLTPAFSAQLTEEKIQNILSTGISAGDWALITLKAFDSQEKLTLTMEDQEEFVILVTDDSEESDDGIPRQLDGSNIEGISAKWITQDTVDNGDDSFLYVQPADDENQSVRLQFNYALSGEHDYGPGDITITIPASMFKDRDGNDYGKITIPYPEDPSTKQEFNWKLVGDNYVLTNTRTLPAATKGYIQIAFSEMEPWKLVDMEVSEEYDAYIEVVTHRGNTIALRSNSLTAQFDTQAEVIKTVKRVSGSPERVPVERIPEEQRIEGETEYVLVKWYTVGTTDANTEYTLDLTDSIPQDAVVVTGTDGTEKTEAEFKGFVVNDSGDTLSEDGTTLQRDGVYEGHEDGLTRYYYFYTAYPASQFEAGVEYTFHNDVTYTVTEVDPDAETTNPNVNDGEDPKLVTTQTASAQTVYKFDNPEWENPTGHFMVTKNGNDDKVGSNITHMRKSYGVADRSDLHIWGSLDPIDGWYGIYPSGLNDLQDEYAENGEDGKIRLSYTIDSIGYVMPWMFDSESYDTQGAIASRLSKNYNLPVTMVTTDTGVSIGRNTEKLTVFDDYTFTSIEFPADPWVYTGVPKNINPDGSWSAEHAGDGTFEYERDGDKANWPDITLQIQRNGSWEDYATASWRSGSFKLNLADGGSQTSRVLALPEDTENFRTTVTLQNTSTDEEANICLQAALDYDVRVVIELKSTDELMEQITEMFAKSNRPSTSIYNGVELVGLDSEGEEIVYIPKDGYDSVRGYTTETMVYPKKTSTQTIDDVDYVNKNVTIHYNATVEKRSLINDEKTYEEAVEEGRLVTETHGVWRDLLPQGVTPVLSTVQLRDEDIITDVYTIPNYKNSGRTLLVVEADLTPVTVTYESGDSEYYEDMLEISFDANYSFDALADYGEKLHNVISFESSNDFIGTVENYSGEPDDPYSSNNVSTALAFADDTEKDTMKDLDPDRDTPSFVYAGTNLVIDIVSAAQTSLSKDVMVNNDGWWSTGLYYDDEEANKRTVYEGGVYSYRLRMMSDDDTISKDLIIYDSLENYWAVDGNDSIDIDAPHWKGTFTGVDTSELERMGCAPVVYYSEVENLQLSDETDPNKGNPTNMDLTNSSIWTEASAYEAQHNGDVFGVRAIAIDATKASSGEDFVLQPLESAIVVVNMRAPSGEEATEYISQKGVWGDSAHAYNNIYMLCTSIDKDSGEADSDNFVRKDYTKVGLMQYRYDVDKKWSDDDDRDGIRPESVTLHLYADGEDTGKTLTLPVTVIDEETGAESVSWKGSFEDLAYTDPEGNIIKYSVKEEEVPGYAPSLTVINGNSIILTNKHTPEKTEVSGQKTWEGDIEDFRPESIELTLYADGEKADSLTVKPDASGNWEWAFTDLYKYRDGGQEIVYTVKEVLKGKGQSYEAVIVPGDSTDHPVFNITNTYHPYGDLLVSKEVLGGTDATADKEFTFTFQFTREEQVEQEDGSYVTEEAPVDTEFEYVIIDEDGNETDTTGTVTTNDSVTIKAGQKIRVKEIDEGIKYLVTESDTPGFELTSVVGDTGTIVPNTDNTADFTNTYTAKDKVNLKAKKVLYNRELLRAQFKFELYQVADDGTETLIRNASNDRPDDPVLREDGTVESSAANVTFGALEFTQEDSGKTFTYHMKETISDASGYTYDETVYTVTITVTDNGDGTLDIQTVYYKEDETGNLVEVPDEELGTDGEMIAVVPAVFENTYTASGMIPLTAWKTLEGRTLTEGEFTFELLNEQTKVVGTTTNKADGTVTFAPEGKDGVLGNRDDIAALKFTEKDIGKTYYFAVREKKGTDASVDYDDSYFGYSIKVEDNGDGTLSLTQGLATPTIENTANCTACSGRGYLTYNTFSLSQYPIPLTDLSASGINIYNYLTLTNSNYGVQDLDAASAALSAMLQSALEKGTYSTATYNGTEYVSSIVYSGNDAAVSGSFNTFAENINSNRLIPSDILNNGVGRITYSVSYGPFPYSGVDSAVLTIVIYPACSTCGGTGKQAQITGWTTEEAKMPVFQNSTNPGNLKVKKTVQDAEDADPDQEFKFHLTLTSDKLPEADLSIDTSGYVPEEEIEVIPTTTKFYTPPSTLPEEGAIIVHSGVQSGCSWNLYSDGTLYIYPTNGTSGQLGNISPFIDTGQYNVSGGSKPTWYQYRESVRFIKVADGVQSGLALDGAFANMTNLEYADLGGLDTSTCTGSGSNMNRMFYDDSNLKRIDFGSKFTTSNVEGGLSPQGDYKYLRTFAMMFSGCTSLEQIDLSGFDIARFTSAYTDIDSCSSLERVVLPSTWDAVDNDDYLPVPPATTSDGRKTTGKWVREDGTYGPFTPAELAAAYKEKPEALAGVWVWDYKGPASYKVAFDNNGGGGTMKNQKILVDEDTALKACSFYRFGYTFTEWNTAADGSGTSYADQAVVNNLAAEDETITLYAQWEANEGGSTDTISQDFILHAGESLQLDNLPAGTAYQVWEETPDGWVLVSSSNASGLIVPLVTTEAVFRNKYKPTSTSVQFSGIKHLDGEPAERAFTFVLKEDGTEKQVVSSQTGGLIQFDPIEYTAEDVGIHTYTIKETPDEGDSSVVYDSHVENITVTITQNEDGSVTAEKSSNSNGFTFNNTTNEKYLYGNLSISKKVENGTDANKDAEFEFQIQLATADGVPYTADVAWTKGEEKGTSTPNMGVVTFKLKADETLTIENLPVGATYTVTEINLPTGWELNTDVTSEETLSGTIVANATASNAVEITNTYSAEGWIELEAHKKLQGGTLQDGQFTFELYDEEGGLIGQATNGVLDETEQYYDEDGNLVTNPWVNTGKVTFDPINYTIEDVGTHTYKIVEKRNNDDNTTYYDSHEETVTVTVADAGKGRLTATAEYDEDEALFVNRKVSILIRKVDDNDTALEGAVFELYVKDGDSFRLLKAEDYSWLDANNQFTVGADGFVLSELADGTYQLKEITPPENYVIENNLPVTFTISEAAVDETKNVLAAEVTYVKMTDEAPDTYTIKNYYGAELPMSGGIGTTIFYVLGSILVIGAGIILVTRRRMNVR